MNATNDFAWAFGWEALVAIGTLALAVFTAWLALSTRSLARETSRELRATWRPVLVVDNVTSAVWLRFFDGHDTGTLRFTLRNDGRGPALGLEAHIDRASGTAPRAPSIDLGILPTGASREVTAHGVPVHVDDNADDSDHPRLMFLLALTCQDVAERPYLTAVALLGEVWDPEPDQNGEIHVTLGIAHTAVREQRWPPFERPEDWIAHLET
jgi:hypothetical protein